MLPNLVFFAHDFCKCHFSMIGTKGFYCWRGWKQPQSLVFKAFRTLSLVFKYRLQRICSRPFVVLFRNLVTLSQKSSKISIFCHFVHFVNFHPLPAIAGRPDHMESKCLEKIELLVYQTHMGVAGEGNYSSLDLLCKFTKEGLWRPSQNWKILL